MQVYPNPVLTSTDLCPFCDTALCDDCHGCHGDCPPFHTCHCDDWQEPELWELGPSANYAEAFAEF